MDAAQIIHEIQRLPTEEMGKVVEFVLQNNANNVRFAEDEKALEAADAVFGEHPELFRKLAQ